jgi:ABC-type uncharacterized transport system permease subunit
MDTQTKQPNRANKIVPSVLAGVGVAILSLLVGTILDYIIVQILSQHFISGCSEDCYFAYFNSLFVVVALLSVVIGVRAGLRNYKSLSENS